MTDRLTEIKARQTLHDGATLRTQGLRDIDWLIAQLEEAHLQIRDLRRGLSDVLLSARDATVAMYATEELARMVLTNETIPTSPTEGGERR